MFRCILPLALVLLGATVAPAAAETWDCGESTEQSAVFALSTENCGESMGLSDLFTFNTDDTPCGVSTVASEQNIIVDTIWSPGSIKKHPLGKVVTLPNLPVTRTFAQRFYIEAVDRSSGIGVIASSSAEPGRLATVTGTIASISGEIVLDAPSVTLHELGACPKPVGISSPGLRLGVGADPTGLLVRVWGKAISVPQGQTWYLVSDGGNQFTVAPEGVGRPVEGADVILTGIPGVAEIGGEQVRVFRVNSQ